MLVAMVVNAKGYDWKTWLVGILRSAISGGAGAVVGMLGPMATDAHDFNFQSAAGIKHTVVSMLVGFGVSAFVHMMMYLQTHSAPDLINGKAVEVGMEAGKPQ